MVNATIYGMHTDPMGNCLLLLVHPMMQSFTTAVCSQCRRIYFSWNPHLNLTRIENSGWVGIIPRNMLLGAGMIPICCNRWILLNPPFPAVFAVTTAPKQLALHDEAPSDASDAQLADLAGCDLLRETPEAAGKMGRWSGRNVRSVMCETSENIKSDWWKLSIFGSRELEDIARVGNWVHSISQSPRS